MRITEDRYTRDRVRHDLALRMIRHEARTYTIRACTGLSEDRIRKLYKSYIQPASRNVQRRRGKSPRQTAYFMRNTRAQLETSLFAGILNSFGLLHPESEPRTHGELFCDAYETYCAWRPAGWLSFEHAWFLWQLLWREGELCLDSCPQCESLFVRERAALNRRPCSLCRMKRIGTARTIHSVASLAQSRLTDLR
jgi:hypothetical protein